MKYQSLFIACLSAWALSAEASVVSINFSNNADGNLDPSDTAGVYAASYWNNVSSSTSGLIDETGAATSIGVSFSGVGFWYDGAVSTSTPDGKLFRRYMDIQQSPVEFTLSGFDPQQTYQIYVYSDGDNTNVGTPVTRGSFFSIGDQEVTILDEAGVNFSGSFVEVPVGSDASGNYTVFTVSGLDSYVLTGMGLLLDSNDGYYRAPLSAIQIVAVPEPSVAGLMGVFGGLSFLLLRRKKAVWEGGRTGRPSSK